MYILYIRYTPKQYIIDPDAQPRRVPRGRRCRILSMLRCCQASCRSIYIYIYICIIYTFI